MPVPCEDCGRMMSASAAVCPHCGHRQSDRDMVDPELVGEKKKPKNISISGDEAAALFEVKGISSGAMEYERPRGPMVLILPRAEASGWIRGLEWFLTILALPMLVGGLGLVALRPRMWRYVGQGGEIGLSLMCLFFGGLSLFFVGIFGGSNALIYGIGGVSGGALIARLVVRAMRPG